MLMKILACLLLIGFLVFLSPSFLRPASAIVPEVRNVTAYNVGGSTYLNVTVFHDPEIPAHYVNLIEVTFNGNTTTLTIGPQTLAPDNTFIVQYDAGPISGTPTATVRAHCIVNNWSVVNWTGPIPEFSSFFIVPLFMVATLLAVAVYRRKRFESH